MAKNFRISVQRNKVINLRRMDGASEVLLQARLSRADFYRLVRRMAGSLAA